MINRLHHTGFVVKDLERMKAFYRDVLGLEVQGEYERTPPYTTNLLALPNAHLRVVFLGKGPGHLVELVHYVTPQGGDGHQPKNAFGAAHLCFQVDDLGQVYRSLSGKGLRFVNPPAERQDPVRGRVRACYAQDPEGNWLEFVEFQR